MESRWLGRQQGAASHTSAPQLLIHLWLCTQRLESAHIIIRLTSLALEPGHPQDHKADLQPGCSDEVTGSQMGASSMIHCRIKVEEVIWPIPHGWVRRQGQRSPDSPDLEKVLPLLLSCLPSSRFPWSCEKYMHGHTHAN